MNKLVGQVVRWGDAATNNKQRKPEEDSGCAPRSLLKQQLKDGIFVF